MIYSYGRPARGNPFAAAWPRIYAHNLALRETVEIARGNCRAQEVDAASLADDFGPAWVVWLEYRTRPARNPLLGQAPGVTDLTKAAGRPSQMGGTTSP